MFLVERLLGFLDVLLYLLQLGAVYVGLLLRHTYLLGAVFLKLHSFLSIHLDLVPEEGYFLIDQLDLLLVLVDLLRKFSVALFDDQIQSIVLLSSFFSRKVHGFQVLTN